jgi:hypothetical protein
LLKPLTLLFLVLLRPAAGWAAVRERDPSASRSFFGTALPLALLPAIAWPLGKKLPFLPSFSSTLVLSLSSVLLLACGVYLLAAFFGAQRNWQRSVAVAAYATSPVFLSGALLVIPVLVIVSVLAFVHYLVLCAVGLRTLLRCKEDDVAGYVASASVFAGATAMALGALCSAMGMI